MSLTNDELLEWEKLVYEDELDDSRDGLFNFTKTTFKQFKPEHFHKTFYDVLNRFANHEISKLIWVMGPQHGKSEGSSRRLPAFIAGIRPDDKIALVSYSATKAQKFGREIMSIMREKEYVDIFPDVEYPERGYTGTKANTNIERESINSRGSMKFVGVEGPLTGDSVDVLILDDLYKGWMDANSPVTQEAVWDWYLSVAETRLHNDSQQLITFTRWSENDLIAKLIDLGLVVVYDGSEDLDDVIATLDDKFLLINFQSLKEGGPTAFDSRTEGEALWESKHSKKKLESFRAKSPDKFDCLYQGSPTSKEGLLYQNPFKTYTELPEFKIKKNFTDTADTGKDKLCSINYGLSLSDTDGHLYVMDVLYTDKPMEFTEPAVSEMLVRDGINETRIESNNGGRGFARNVERLVKEEVNTITFDWFHQSSNKEARIYSNSASVNRLVVFPADWHIRWPEFHQAVTKYKKVFSSNKFDDGADVLTGMIESEENTTVVHTPNINTADLHLF